MHSFSDGSGTVFFNLNTGETLALDFDANEIKKILLGDSDFLNNFEAISQLAKVMFLSSDTSVKI